MLPGPAPEPSRQRAHGSVRLTVERLGPSSFVRGLAEAGSARLRLPTTRDGVPEAVLINTAGGIAGGDRLETEIRVGPGAVLVATTAAAERAYRSAGATATVASRLVLDEGARLLWLPQETILFDRARLRRSLAAEIAPGASALLFEATVFGRAARGERVEDAFYEDRWHIRRGGRLVYADTLRLDGDVAARLERPAVAGGCRALATLLHVAPDAEGRLDEARALLDGAGAECGASAWNGLLLVRWLAPTIGQLRRDAARFITAWTGRPLPRVWTL